MRAKSFDRADQLSLQKGLLLWKPEPKLKAARKDMGAERTYPGGNRDKDSCIALGLFKIQRERFRYVLLRAWPTFFKMMNS